jgi:hypothetical protein
MRKALILIAAVMVLASPMRADEAADIVDKAIKAHGGEANLTKFKAGHMTLKGALDIMGQSFEFTQDAWYMTPDKFKEQSDLDIMGQKIKVVTVVNGDKITLNANGMDVDLPDEMKKDIKDAIWLLRFGTLTGLKDKSVKLSPLGESKVNDKPAVGLKVAAEGHKDVNIYFDKATGMIAKTERRAVDFNTQQEVKEERFIQEWQDAQGIKAPKKLLIHRDGKKFLEADVTQIKYHDKLDDSVFQP